MCKSRLFMGRKGTKSVVCKQYDTHLNCTGYRRGAILHLKSLIRLGSRNSEYKWDRSTEIDWLGQQTDYIFWLSSPFDNLKSFSKFWSVHCVRFPEWFSSPQTSAAVLWYGLIWSHSIFGTKFNRLRNFLCRRKYMHNPDT